MLKFYQIYDCYYHIDNKHIVLEIKYYTLIG